MDETLTRIYLLSEEATGVPMYVGLTTTNIKRRLRKHLEGCHPSTQEWMLHCKKHNIKVAFSILDTCKRYQADAFEMYWIARKMIENKALLNKRRPTNFEMIFAAQLRHYYKTGQQAEIPCDVIDKILKMPQFKDRKP